MIRWHSGVRAGALLVLLLAAAGCSPAAMREQAQRLLDPPAAAPAAPPPADPSNRILLQGDDGNLYLADPDGKERFALTDDASRRRIYGQPTWSPDGERIAWNELTADGAGLLTSRFDGSERTALAVPFLPFYLYWSPTGGQLAYLSNWRVVDEPSLALRLVNLGTREMAVRTLAAGQPLYFAWSPDGSRLLAHIDDERVEVYEVAAAASITGSVPVRSLVISGGAFAAPQWAANGEQLVYAVADERTQRLLVTDLAGEPLQDVTDYEGRISFSLSPDARLLAYVATDPQVQAGTLGALYVADVQTRRTRELSDRPVLAFYWSPDARKLAFLSLEAINGRVGLRWHVWDGERTRAYARFLPSAELLQNYLPFFDQYAQSHHVWSPAGDAFVFAGELENGERGIWVQRLGTGEEGAASGPAPISLGPGVFATWSPR